MRALAIASAFLAVVSLSVLASADSESFTCTKPAIRGSLPEDGAVDVPINGFVQLWMEPEEIECAEPEKTYRLRFDNGSGAFVDDGGYLAISAEPESLWMPPNTTFQLSLLEDDIPVWGIAFTTGTEPAAPPVAPVETELVSLTFDPVEGDDSSYHAFARVRFRLDTEDPLASAVFGAVGGPSRSRARKPGNDGWYEMIGGTLAKAGTSVCFEAGMQNAAHEVAYSEPLCGDVPPPAAGCSVGGAPDARVGVGLGALLLGLVRRRRRGAHGARAGAGGPGGGSGINSCPPSG